MDTAADASIDILPPLVVRVGVTGHRAKRLASADQALLATRVRSVLTVVRDVANEVSGDVVRSLMADAASKPALADRPRVRVVSSIAEGADRLVAREGLALEFALHCPLPRTRASYERDFASEASITEFRDLLVKADAVLELEARQPGEETVGYEQAGRVVLRQSDVLIAIWDGAAPAGRGGTGQMVAEAIALELPVVVIEPDAPHAMRLLPAIGAPALGDAALAELAERLRAALRPPEPAGAVARLFTRLHRWPVHLPVYRWFCGLIARRRAPSAAAVSQPTSQLFRWADARATTYGQRYRNSFVANYLLAPLAVLLGALTLAHHVFAIGEFATIVAILAITTAGRRGRWHEHWIQFRLLAEQLRQLDMLHPIGRVPPTFHVPVTATADDPSRLPVSWLLRAQVRACGLPTARVDAGFLERYRASLAALLTEQRDYHAHAASLAHALHHRLHRAGTILFALTLAACVVHYGTGNFEEVLRTPGDWLGKLLTFLAVFLPACGASLAAINNQGEFARQERRSCAMLAHHKRLLADLASAPTTSDALGAIAEATADAMTAETLEWQVVFSARPLTLPA